MKITKQNKMVVGVISLVLVLTVGYALFSETLNINGTAKAGGNFNLIFSEVLRNNVKKEGATIDVNNITIKDESKTLSIGDVTLNYPSAYVKVPAKIKNEGTIDAVLKGIRVENPNAEDIEVSYSGVKKDELFKSGEEKEITIMIRWKKESTIQVEKQDFNIFLDYEQAPDGYVPPKGEYAVGDEFCLGNECFYTISDNGDTVTALAKYNLLVGDKVVLNDAMDDLESIIPIETDTEGYGLQSEKAKGYEENAKEIYGSIIYFSDTNYWYNAATGKLKPEYGTGYPANIFDSNSKIYPIVKKYENYLKELGKISVKANLMTYEQIISLGCTESISSDIGGCKVTGAPEWVYTTTYWVASAFNNNQVYRVGSDGGFYWRDYDFIGVRPVITIDKTEI